MIAKKYNAVVGKINGVCDVFVGVSMLAMLVVLTIQIFSRFISFTPLPWSQDLLTFLLVANGFLGAGSATGRGKQIRLEFFAMMLPKKVEEVVYAAADLISIVFLGIVTKQAFELAGENMKVIVGSSPIAFGIYYLVVSFGAIVMILNFISMFINDIKKVLGKEDGEVSK